MKCRKAGYKLARGSSGISGRRVIMRDEIGREVLEVGQSGYWGGTKV